MDRTIEVLRTVLPVILMIGIGMLCRVKVLISREGINALKNVVVNITLPAVLLKAFATTQYTFMDVVIPLMMFGVCLIAWGLGKALGRLLKLPSRFVPFLTTFAFARFFTQAFRIRLARAIAGRRFGTVARVLVFLLTEFCNRLVQLLYQSSLLFNRLLQGSKSIL